MNERVAFRSLEDALVFAFYNWHAVSGTVEEPSFVRFISKNSREQLDEKPQVRRVFGPDVDRMPDGYDAAGQAGMIKTYINDLPEPEQSHIKAQYLVWTDRSEAKQRLVTAILPTLPTGVHKRRLIADLVSKFYGKKGKELALKALAKRYEVGQHAVSYLNRNVNTALRAIAVRAETRVYDYLQERGVIA